ncbi:Aquaporin-3 [Tyrophagus putrescentiae]|nr:Aquaporin-3 [Tyrophagus putrescentiae]
MTLTCLGCCGNAFINLRNFTASPEHSQADLIEVSTIWGVSLTAALYISSGVSGGHLNPAISIGLASVGKLAWKKVPVYLFAQYLGALAGALLALATYWEAINALTPMDSTTMGIFGIYSAKKIKTAGAAVLDQLFGTATFLLVICAIRDRRNSMSGGPCGLEPFAIGFANIDILHLSFGYNCGTPLNPARDFSPRLMGLLFGWGSKTLSNTSHFWTPFIGCHFGAIVGCWLYRWMIENHWPKEQKITMRRRSSEVMTRTEVMKKSPTTATALSTIATAATTTPKKITQTKFN